MPASLAVVADDAATCTRCALAAGRTNVVFGTGDTASDLMFIGEGPGAEEDTQGLPFVGRSGKLLDQLLFEEMGLTRDRVYIANVVKCRPPNNRDPLPGRDRGVPTVPRAPARAHRPEGGRHARASSPASSCWQSKEAITRLRGRSYPFATGVLVPTVHPAYVLRGGGEPMAQMRADLVRAKQALADAGSPLVTHTAGTAR